MKKFNRKDLLIFIIICLIGFIAPFVTKTSEESLNSTLSISFTIISVIVSIITLIVAVIFFDRYGFDTKFKERQLDTVLSLVNELKLLDLTISNGKCKYLNYVRYCGNLDILPKEIYGADKRKILLVPYNYDKLIKTLYTLYKNPWLPIEIKEKMSFMYFFATETVTDFENSNYVKLDINNMGAEPWVITAPEFTFDNFSINFSLLLATIIDWISEHSSVKIDFDLLEEK